MEPPEVVLVDPTFSISSRPDLGVTVADSIAGALGEWSTEKRLAIAIPDGTRPLNPSAALEALMERCVQVPVVIIGLGLHRPMAPHEMHSLRRFQPVQHDPDVVVATKVVDGVPGAVSRFVAHADFSLSVGVVELHQYAGFSGGHKGVSVGCGGRETLLSLHSRERILDPKVRLGRLQGNPFRAVVDALGEAARCRWALLWSPLAKKWIFGPPQSALEVASTCISPFESVDRLFPGAVISIPPTKGASLYQASRGATYLAFSHQPPLLPGASLLLDATLQEGLGTEAGFVRALTQGQYPFGSLLKGEPPKGAGAQRAVMIARLLEKYPFWLRGCKSPEKWEKLGFRVWPSERPVPESWLKIKNPFECLPQKVS